MENMKNIKELGLETIQLEDQVLLVDKKSKLNDGCWFYNNFDDHQPKIQRRKGNWTTCFNEFKILFSTKPLEGLPLLVIEDESEELSLDVYRDYPNNPKDKIEWRYNHDKNAYRKRKAFVKGFNKAKETYKFTEEDLRKAIECGRSMGYEFASKETYSDSEELDELEKEQKEHVENYIQSITKKELWVKVEWDCCGRCDDIEDKCTGMWKLKIEKNVIKAVWK